LLDVEIYTGFSVASGFVKSYFCRQLVSSFGMAAKIGMRSMAS
jgi:hypothetical protein